MGAQTYYTYEDRIKLLRDRKIEQTKAKVTDEGGLDEDDYGRITPPGDFKWELIPNHENGSFYGFDGWSENFYSLMSCHPIYVDPLDAFSGRWIFFLSRMKGPAWNPDFDYSHLLPGIEKYNIKSGIGYDAHFAPDYNIGLALGFGGLLEKLDKYEKINPPSCKAFYDAERKTIRAVQLWIRRTTDEIYAMIEREGNKQLKDNLREMAGVNENILNNPPSTLREACQWICWFNMASRTYNRDGAGGQLDELLRPYYENDTAAGIIDDEEAKFYFACLLLNDTHYYQLGGPDETGKDMVSHISHLILEGARMLNSSCNITIRVHDGLDKNFFIKSVRYLFENGNGWPRYSGDKALVEGFMRCGFSEQLARKRIAVGCNWMSLPGLEYTMNDLVKINLAKVFEASFWEMMDAGAGACTADLWDIFAKNIEDAVSITGQCLDFHLKYQVHNEPELVLNLLSHGPVERGLDVSCGGAQYYNLAIDGVGLALISDCFAALEVFVEKEKRISWKQTADLMKSNFRGVDGEYYRLMLQSGPKYGGGCNLSEEWAVKLSKYFTERIRALNHVYPGRNFIPGWFSWANTIEFGQNVGALPNGRKSGEPVSHGANPMPKFRNDGAVTALANIVAKIQPGYGNTAPIQLELDPSLACDGESVEKIADLISVMFEKGATLLNINLVDKERILAAHENPEAYPDLVVRVTGFTAYFCMLSPEFRQLVVDRVIAKD